MVTVRSADPDALVLSNLDVSFFEPLHCRTDAFTALHDELPDLSSTDGLVRAAVAVSMHELDDVHPLTVDKALDDLAEQVRNRMRGNDPRAVVAQSHEVLFEEARFRGNRGDDTNPANSYLPQILKTRLGLPITLTLIYKAVLERLGVPVVGVNAPGHFFAGIRGEAVGNTQAPDQLALIDPFAGGRLLSRNEAINRIVAATGGNLVFDETENLLPIATHKQWLMRLIRNLKRCFEKLGQAQDAQAMTEMMHLVEAEG